MKAITYSAAVAAAIQLDHAKQYAQAVDAWIAAANTLKPGSWRAVDRELCEMNAMRAFNLAYSGAPLRVRYWTMAREGEGQQSVTAAGAYMLCGSAMVRVDGVAGGIALSHIQVLGEAADARSPR